MVPARGLMGNLQGQKRVSLARHVNKDSHTDFTGKAKLPETLMQEGSCPNFLADISIGGVILQCGACD